MKNVLIVGHAAEALAGAEVVVGVADSPSVESQTAGGGHSN